MSVNALGETMTMPPDDRVGSVLTGVGPEL